MNSTPFKTAIHVLSAATIIVTGLCGLALLAPTANDRDFANTKIEATSPPNSGDDSEVETNRLTDRQPRFPELGRHDNSEVTNMPNDDEVSREPLASETERPATSRDGSDVREIESKLWLMQQQIDQLAAKPSPVTELVETDVPQPERDLVAALPNEKPRKSTLESTVAEASHLAKPATVLKGERCEDHPDRFTIELQNADVCESLLLLGHLAKLNVVVAPGVRGNISAVSLQDVSAEEALTAITKSLGFVAEHEGPLAFVTTADEVQRRAKAAKETVLKIYRPQHIPVPQLESLIAPLLSKPVYLMTLRNPATASTKEPQSQPLDGVLIVDDPKVIARVDELVAELDQPDVSATRPDTTTRPPQTAQPLKKTKQADVREKLNTLRKISGTAPQRFTPPDAAKELQPDLDVF